MSYRPQIDEIVMDTRGGHPLLGQVLDIDPNGRILLIPRPEDRKAGLLEHWEATEDDVIPSPLSD